MKRFFLVCLLLWVPLPALAIRVTTLYSEKIPVASQNETDRIKAINLSLERVLVKVSGQSAVLKNPFIQSHLKEAHTLLESYGYSSSQGVPYLLETHFNLEGVNRLLQEAKVPIWSVNRPLTVVWIAPDLPAPNTESLESFRSDDTITLLKTQADQRGLPLLFPMMDLKDLSQVSVNDVVTMNAPLLQKSSSRYDPDAILIVHVFKLASAYRIEAKFILGEDERHYQLKGASKEQVCAALMNQLADQLAQKYATVVTEKVTQMMMLKIMAVNEEKDFSQILHYFERLPQVASVEVQQIEGTEILLKIHLRGTEESLLKVVSVGKKLIPVAKGTYPSYQWNP